MKKIILLIAPLAGALLFHTGLNAQVPTKCLEIESILVDACISETDCPGSTEGMNEMVRFITGPAPIAIGDLQFQFYSSTFRGIAQNSTTADLTAQLDASIQGCGHLLEPPGGVIPPGSRAIFVTSTAMCVQANSFTALSDTLYILYQNAGNSQGHFKNNDLVGQPESTVPAAPLMRWLRVSVAGAACGDTATYDANQLVNIHGTYGGTTEENDGATAEFAWPGAPTASYVNHGCQAPFTAAEPVILSAPDPIPCGASVDLIGMVTGPYASVHWQGGGGAFSQPDSLETFYTPGGGDNGNVVVSFCAIGACGDTLCDQLTLMTAPTPQVTITGDSTLCQDADLNTLTANGADSFLWSTGGTTPAIQVGLAQVGTVWVVGTSACGSDSAATTVSIMTDSLLHQDITCNGASTGSLTYMVQGGAPPYSYLWNTGAGPAELTGLPPGSYTVSVTDAEGCTRLASYTLAEPPPLTATVGADTTSCPGTPIELNAEGMGGTPGYTYAWSPEGPLVSPFQTTTYTVVVSDANGCEASPLQVTVNVPDLTSIVISATPQAGCSLCVSFSMVPEFQNGTTWNFGDGSIDNGPSPQHCYLEPGTYTVTAQVDPGMGCTALVELAQPLVLVPPPVADFSYSPATPTASDPTVQFTDLSSGASTWVWQFGDPDGTIAVEPSPSFTYPGVGCYPVFLEVTNAVGCMDSTTQQLCVSGQDSLVVPNVFSPNGDGRNDAFRVTGGGLVSLDVRIVNRWGQEVSRLEQVGRAWDGRSPTGGPLPEGTYFYVLHAVGGSGEVHDLSGSITLLR